MADKRLIYPIYTNSQVARAGDAVRRGRVTEHSEKVIENWRSSHNHVLNTWWVILFHRIQKLKMSATPGQRLKRRNTIYDKLTNRPEMPGMSLRRMHDIAGCRVVFENEEDLYYFRNSILIESRFKHKYIKRQHKDYIAHPKESGYRGVHDVFAYKSDVGRPEKWNGLYVEIQYRTKFQHAWATAVEVADILKKSRTKFSDKADEKQNIFFQYASEIIARVYEGRTSCFPDLSNEELVSGFESVNKETQLLNLLRSVNHSKMHLKDKSKKAIILRLITNNLKVSVVTEGFNSTSEAQSRLYELEKEFPDDNIVLVKADNINDIKNIFRNYFTDSKAFVTLIDNGLNFLNAGKQYVPNKQRTMRIQQMLPLD